MPSASTASEDRHERAVIGVDGAKNAFGPLLVAYAEERDKQDLLSRAFSGSPPALRSGRLRYHFVALKGATLNALASRIALIADNIARLSTLEAAGDEHERRSTTATAPPSARCLGRQRTRRGIMRVKQSNQPLRHSLPRSGSRSVTSPFPTSFLSSLRCRRRTTSRTTWTSFAAA
jgi:hypothetical protein